MKRVEIYLWWTCTNKCIFCVEDSNIKKFWTKKISKNEVLKNLIIYKKKWYEHITFLWWEPTIQENFLFALKVAKELWFRVLVTTNAHTLQFDHFAIKCLPLIDDLILSIHVINKNLQIKTTRTNNPINYKNVFDNIKKFWNWKLLKINVVINKINYNILNKIPIYLNEINIPKNTEIVYTYPDISRFEKPDRTKEYIPPVWYLELYKHIKPAIEECIKNNYKYKIADIPFCCIEEKDIKFTEDNNYSNRIKLSAEDWELDRNIDIPRERRQIKKCIDCIQNKKCWWPWVVYIEFFWDSDINPIVDNK